MGYEMRIFSSPSLMLMRLRVKNGSDFKGEQNGSRGFTAVMSHPARIRWGGRVWVCRERGSAGARRGKGSGGKER